MNITREPVTRSRCLGGTSYARCTARPSSGYEGLAWCDDHDAEGQAHAARDRRAECYRCSARFDGVGSICDACVPARDELRARAEATRAAKAAEQAALVERDERPEVVLVVVPCSGAKLAGPAPAGELYLGSFHRYARATAEVVAGDEGAVAILSALHGLVAPDQVVAPYDVTVGDAGAVDPLTVAEQLAEVGATRVVALTPNGYTAILREACALAGVELEAPLAGSRGIGEQRGRLARLRRGESAIAPAVEAPALAPVVRLPARQLALLSRTADEDGEQLDLVEYAGVEVLSVRSVRLPELALFTLEV